MTLGQQAVNAKSNEITATIDGRYAYPSTGEAIDAATKEITTKRTNDETGLEVHSEKMVKILLRDGKRVTIGDQFSFGRVKEK